MKQISIGYFADGPWAHRAFEKIAVDKRFVIKFICVRYDSGDLTLEEYAKDYGLDLLRNRNVNSVEFIELLKQYKCDLFVSMSFNQIFKKEVYDLPHHKTINCHAGKLPFYRGRNILNWVLINDENEFGITVHYVDDGIDTGDIILQRTYPISDEDSYVTLLTRSYTECANVLYDALIKIYFDEVNAVKQDSIHPVGLYCIQRKQGDEGINWGLTSREIFNFIRAISKPGPMARSFLKDKEIKINKAVLIDFSPKYKLIPGAVVNVDNTSIVVKTYDSTIRITEYEYNGEIRIGDRLI